MRATAEQIAELGPDIIALQEVDLGQARSGRLHQAAFLAEELGMSLRQVRQMIADREIIAARVGERNVVAVPASFVQDGAVVTPLMGTVTVLSDAGFSDEEAIRWLCTPDETLPIDGAPIDMLRAGRKAEVRKRAMEEAF